MLSHSIASKQANKDDNQIKGGSGGGSAGMKTSSLRPPEQTLKCPRCDSANTKFCYYNNYSLAQPRHFCKACRRYWTNGGALRIVPIGGSCRKNKRTKSCSSRFFVDGTSLKGPSSDIEGVKFYGVSTLDFQLGGLNPPPKVATTNQLSSSFGETSSKPSYVNLDPLGFNFHFSSSQQHHHNQNGGGLVSFHEMGTTTNHLHYNTNDLASSIESLSFINQDLHWKLQQQRLAMLYSGGGGQNKVVMESHDQKLQPILFENLDTSKPVQSSMDGDSRNDIGRGGPGGGGLATEWFFDNSYAASTTQNPVTPTDSNSAGNDQNGSINNWKGIQGWNPLNHYSSIP